MDINTLTIIGLDVGRSSAVACKMENQPPELGEFIRRYKPIALKANDEGLKQLLEMGDIFGLEPTGTDHRWWHRQLIAHGKQVLLCSGVRIRSHAKNNGIASKGDKEDAAVIADYIYCQLNRGNLLAFQSCAGNEIQDLRRSLLSCQRHRVKLINQLKARLGDEAPELCKFNFTLRKWASPSVQFWMELLNDQRLGWLSREDVEQIIYWENRECRIEQEIDRLLKEPDFQVYYERLKNWKFGHRQMVPIIGALHPIDQFLDENGNRIIERIHTKNGNRVKLDRSLRGIHRCLGYGRVKIQSGDSWKWARTGDRTILAALYNWVDMMISVRRTPPPTRLNTLYGLPEGFKDWNKKKRSAWIKEHNFRSYCVEAEPRCLTVQPIQADTRQRVGYLPWKDEAMIQKVCEYSLAPPRIAQLQLFYEFGFFEQKQHDRILKTIPYMIRLLAEDLLNIE